MRYLKLIAAAGMIVLGSMVILVGTRNIKDTLQMLNSPLDQASYAGDGSSEPSPEPLALNQVGQADFLPVYSPVDDAQIVSAPEIVTTYHQGNERPDRTLYLSGRPPIAIPEKVVIEAIGVSSTVVPVSQRKIEYQGELYRQWEAPRSGELGWHNTSALVGSYGNTVINGHSSGYGETFRYLSDLENGDIIEIYSGNYRYTYAVANTLILKERWESIETRMQNASWIGPSTDERLTLISCWPYNSNTHRMIVVAIPIDFEEIGMVQVEDS